MPLHRSLTFSELHKAKFDAGLEADLPSSPEGAGDAYWAYDADSGTGAIYLANSDASAWIKLAPAATPTVAVADLTDVDLTGLADGDALTWNSSSMAWEPNAVGVPSVALNDLTDVSTAGVSTGDVITYAGGSWVVATPVSELSDLTDVGTLTTSKGDILAANASNVFEGLSLGSDNQLLTADSAQTLGVKWADPPDAFNPQTTETAGWMQYEDRLSDPGTTPTSGFAYIYIKNGLLYIKLDDDTIIGPFTAAGGVVLDDLADVQTTSPAVAKGSILARNNLEFQGVDVGDNGQVLVADSTADGGVSWQNSEALLMSLILN